jgi:hypothetical protein
MAKVARAERRRKAPRSDRRGENGHASSAPVCIEDRPLSPDQAAEIPKRSLLAATDALDVRTQRGQWWLPE